MSCTVSFVTCSSREEAAKIAETLVAEKIAACVNVVPGVTSVYVWEGKLCRDDEHLLVIKSTEAAAGRLAGRVRELHSYRVPEVVTIPVATGNADYLKWVEESVR